MKLILQIFFITIFFQFISNEISSTIPCNLRKYPKGYVCVCNETYCDTIGNIQLDNKEDFLLVSSSSGGLRFNVIKGRIYSEFNSESDSSSSTNSLIFVKDLHAENEKIESLNEIIEVSVNIDRSKKFQEILGFGGAMTGAVSHNIELMPSSLQDFIFKSYYSSDFGINYNFMRFTIGACDYDLDLWEYNETPANDLNLSNFTKLYPLDVQRIKQINRLKSITNNDELKIIGTSWSSPTWMKTHQGWATNSTILEKYLHLWAEYYLKWLELFNQSNVSIWGLSTGNEPTNAAVFWVKIKIIDLGWLPHYQGKWVGEHLGPLLRNSEFKDVKLLGLDDERAFLPWWLNQMNAGHPKVTDYLDGIAVHWYLDYLTPTSYLDETHRQYPNKFIMNTESALRGTPINDLGLWLDAEEYIQKYMADFNHWVTGWMDWNLVLNEIGGPNYYNKSNQSPIIFNATSKQEFYKEPIFYAIGHFSKFFTPNSVRIHLEIINANENISTIAFERPDKSLAILIHNNSTIRAIITINENFETLLQILIPPKSVHTLVIGKTGSETKRAKCSTLMPSQGCYSSLPSLTSYTDDSLRSLPFPSALPSLPLYHNPFNESYANFSTY